MLSIGSYRVTQWTTGNVGKSSVAAIANNPTLELVGCYTWCPDKVGQDVGELAGVAPLDIAATNNIDELLALKPDCVVYNPMWIVDRHRRTGAHPVGRRQRGGLGIVHHDSPATEIPVGFGKPINDPDLQPMAAQGTAVFAEACV